MLVSSRRGSIANSHELLDRPRGFEVKTIWSSICRIVGKPESEPLTLSFRVAVSRPLDQYGLIHF